MVLKKLQFLRRIVVLRRLLFPAVLADNDSARGKIRVRGVSCRLLPLVAFSCLAQILRADFFEDYEYTDNGTEITIDYYMGIGDESGAVVIPESITGKPVTRIGNYAFRGRNEVTSVLIPGTVTSIGDYAFAECGGLAAMTIPDSVTSLGEGAFSGCNGLTSVTVPGSVSHIAEWTFMDCHQLTGVTLSSGVTSIGNMAFAFCAGLTSVALPDSLTSIAGDAFRQCTSLTSITADEVNPVFSSAGGVLVNKTITHVILCPEGVSGSYAIPDGITEIGANAFANCAALTGVTIPASVTAIGGGAFSWCGGLTTMSIPAGVTSIGGAAFANCGGLVSIEVDVANPNFTSTDGVLFNRSKSLLIQYPAGIGGDYVIPEGVTRIGDGAFSGCGQPSNSELPAGLTGIMIPDSVTSIGISAFSGCNRLTSITIPAGVTRIEDSTFNECRGLTNVTIPEGVTSIGFGAFSGCGQPWDPEQSGGLTSVSLPDTVTSIGDSAFSNCNRLATINIPAGVSRIGNWTFAHCNALMSVTIPSGVTSIGDSAFYCGDGWGTPVGLMSVSIPGTVTSIGNHAFSGCNRLTALTIPTSVASIGSFAFQGCRALTSVEIPEGVTTISEWLFHDCSGLTSVTLPTTLSTIADSSFSGCYQLTSVTIPYGVSCIGNSAFHGCSGLTCVDIPDSVTTLGDGAFAYCIGMTSVTLPSGLKEIQDNTFAECRRLANVTIPESITSIGSGAFYKCGDLMHLTFPGCVTAIGNHAFVDCISLTSVEMPDSVTNIGHAAFQGCSGLMNVVLSGNITVLPQGIFYNCSALEDVVIPTGVTDVESAAFLGCSSLKSVLIPGSVINIGDSAFLGCSSLTSVAIPASTTFIASSAFYECSSMKLFSVAASNQNYSSSVGVLFNKSQTLLIQFPAAISGFYRIPAGVTSISSNAFSECSGLSEVIFPNSVTSIGIQAFMNCSGLSSITIPPGLTLIENWAFLGCRGLSHINIPSGVTSIGQQAFAYCTSLESAIFAGNAPLMGEFVFGNVADGFTVYYSIGMTGFSSPTWMGYPAVAMEPAPVVVTRAASGITAGLAVLHGTVNPSGTTTITQFEYGPTSEYGHIATAPLWPNNGTTAVTVSAIITGLQPGQIYHYRLTATNPSGTSLGDDITFNTNMVLTVLASHGMALPSSEQYIPGTIVEITATPNPGYLFGGWTGDAAGSANPLTVLMETNKTITANFLPDTTDADGDGLSNHDEIVTYGTNPTLEDTDGDDLNDASEVGLGHFWIIAGTFTWAQARADAHARGGELACFPTDAQWNRAIESLGANALDGYTGLWIGASDAAEEGNWTWVNGEPFTFSQWATSRPSVTAGNTLDYAEVSGGGGAELEKWYDRTAMTTRDGYILESGYLTDPNNADIDSDGLNDGAEKASGSNPFLADTDGDGFDDGFEVNAGFKPTLAGSTPEGIVSLRKLPGPPPVAVEFRFNAANGVSYRIEDSSDLNDWHIIENDIIGQGSTVTRTFSTQNLPQRFFRARRN